MSDHRAIGAVSATLKYLLQEWLIHDLDGTTPSVVLTLPETDSSTTTPTLSLFLYHVAPNPNLRNDELPVRRSDGTLVSRPRLALDLHYLLTAYGGTVPVHPQVLMGSALRTLSNFPVLTPEIIDAAITAEIGATSGHPLEGADLARQIERVRLSPLGLSLEELTKLWSVMLQKPYGISMAWQASVVFIDSTSAPTTVLPVKTVQLFALPKPIIQLEAVESSLGKDEPITASSTLYLRGKGLKGDTTRVRVLGTDYTPTSTSPKLVSFTLSTIPSTTLRAGVLGISVVHHPTNDDGDVLAFGFESNALGFALRPEITPPATGSVAGSITIGVVPDLARNQRITLYLYGTESYSIDATIDSETASEVTIDLSTYDITPDTYLVRLSVDGAQSVLETDSGGSYVGPELELT